MDENGRHAITLPADVFDDLTKPDGDVGYQVFLPDHLHAELLQIATAQGMTVGEAIAAAVVGYVVRRGLSTAYRRDPSTPPEWP